MTLLKLWTKFKKLPQQTYHNPAINLRLIRRFQLTTSTPNQTKKASRLNKISETILHIQIHSLTLMLHKEKTKDQLLMVLHQLQLLSQKNERWPKSCTQNANDLRHHQLVKQYQCQIKQTNKCGTLESQIELKVSWSKAGKWQYERNQPKLPVIKSSSN